MKKAIYRILYKRIDGHTLYVSSYETFKLNGQIILGAFKYTTNIDEAKRVPDNITNDNLLDSSLNNASITLLPNIK